MEKHYSSRIVQSLHRSSEISEGKGAFVHRSVGSVEIGMLDPFIILDAFTVGQPAGFTDHAHRGLETVTYVHSTSLGMMCHEDFLGHKGTLRPGDVQFMNAGKG